MLIMDRGSIKLTAMMLTEHTEMLRERHAEDDFTENLDCTKLISM
jgi:hypothetical protein